MNHLSRDLSRVAEIDREIDRTAVRGITRSNLLTSFAWGFLVGVGTGLIAFAAAWAVLT